MNFTWLQPRVRIFMCHSHSMIGENRQLGTDEPVEFEK